MPAPVDPTVSATRLRVPRLDPPPRLEMPVDPEEGYARRLGSLDDVPVLAVSMDELLGRALDHRAGFLVSRIDGESSIEALLDVGGMPRVDALRILCELFDEGIVRRR